MTTAVKPILGHKRPIPAHVAVYAFVIIPFLALLAAVPVAWGWGLAWLDVILAAAFYTGTCLGATVGFHRCLRRRPPALAVGRNSDFPRSGSGMGSTPPRRAAVNQRRRSLLKCVA
jgi:hypothetical protein